MLKANLFMRRILIFSTAYLSMQGGAELAVKEITDRLSDFSAQGGPASGWEFDLICARLERGLPQMEKIGRVNVHRIGFGYKFDKILLLFFGFLKAKEIFKKTLRQAQGINTGGVSNNLLPERSEAKSKADIILWGIMASWGSLAALLFKIFYPRTPFLLTLQEGDADDYVKRGRWGLINLAWRWLLAKADFVQAISNYLADMAREYGYRGEIEIAPNGVDLNKYQVSSIKYQENTLRNEIGIKKNERIIITVSRLVEKNGINDLIVAFNILNTKYKIHNTKLLIIGSGTLRKKLEDMVKKLGIEEKILFLGDISNEEVPKYLALADVFARPSLSEGLGTAFLEAMAAGVPIIGTRIGGITDFLRDFETGLFCEIKNPESIAEKIKLLLEDENLRRKLIANGQKLVEEEYDWDKIVVKMENIFNKLL